jgi:hypothetical protein
LIRDQGQIFKCKNEGRKSRDTVPLKATDPLPYRTRASLLNMPILNDGQLVMNCFSLTYFTKMKLNLRVGYRWGTTVLQCMYTSQAVCFLPVLPEVLCSCFQHPEHLESQSIILRDHNPIQSAYGRYAVYAKAASLSCPPGPPASLCRVKSVGPCLQHMGFIFCKFY